MDVDRITWVWRGDVIWAKRTGGEVIRLGTYEQLLGIATEIAVSPGRAWILACAMCKAVCTTVEPCPCTERRRIDRRTTIGDHFRLMPAPEFLARVRALEDRTRRASSLTA